MRWYGHVLRKDEGEGVKQAWNLKVDGRRGTGRPKLTWKSIVEGQCKKIGSLAKISRIDRDGGELSAQLVTPRQRE